VNRYIFAQMYSKTIVTFPPPMTLTFDLLTSKLLCQFTHDVGNLSSLFEHCVVFGFQANGGHRTDRQTDGHGVTRNAGS